jgi:opacity protein-like surface antigen
MIMKSWCVFLLGAASAFAQPFGFGVKAGVPLTDFIDAAKGNNLTYVQDTHRYIIGLQGEIRLPFGLGVEVDALYRHVSYSGTVSGTSFDTSANAWEFPILGKYRFKAKVVRPFVDAGVAFDTLQGLKQSVVSGNPLTYDPSSEVRHKTTKGFVAGVGVEIHVPLIHLQPEIRYTRWGEKHFGSLNGLLDSKQNQAEFLLGITF